MVVGILGALIALASIMILVYSVIRKKTKKLWGIGIALGIILFIVGVAISPSGPVMKFETIGTKGATVLVTLVSPSPDAVSPGDLADRLREDWQNHLDILSPPYNNQIHVRVFDNKDAPQRWLEIWDTSLSMSDQEWDKEQARIFPHWVADYDRNKTTGLHEVKILSRDVNGKAVQTIKF